MHRAVRWVHRVLWHQVRGVARGEWVREFRGGLVTRARGGLWRGALSDRWPPIGTLARAWPTRLEAPESCVETPYENGRRLMAASSASNEGAREGVASKEAAAPPRPDATASSADSVGARVLPPPPTPSPTMRVHKQRKIKGRTAPEPAAAHVCAAYCLASGYRLSELRDVLAAMPLITAIDTTQYANDVLHFRVGVAAAPDEQPHPTPPPTGHAFFFESGASVFWDVHEEARCELLRIARRCDTQPGYVSAVALEEFDHEFEFFIARDSTPESAGGAALTGASEAAHLRPDTESADQERPAAGTSPAPPFPPYHPPVTFRNDCIYLQDYADTLSLVAVSFGLAQSAKLLVFEFGIDRLVQDTRRLPEELALHGRFQTVASGDIKRRIGQLLIAKYSVALLSDILDTPDMFWEYSNREPVYNQCVQMVDLQKRARLLDKRMDIVKDSLALLNSELTSESTHRVERAIVALIAIEVAMEILNKLW
ncbi:hypothetical protein CDCA_CDCA12G3519 [Cyanidium caldarium]|uniref:DUF155 domain-containing protein n=1 Tax=Cyanidium caldarium TaxID=2771 RepID=A0AAV9IZ06_CYACA|nr:hypothetical protein CDCA_CDCA12G3519 [Cyanidium caldarium]